MKKVFSFIQTFVYYLISYIWYFALYLVLIPYLVLLIGKNLDVLLLDYFFEIGINSFSNFYAQLFAFIIGGIGLIIILWSFYTLYTYSRCFPFAFFPFPNFNPKKLSTYGPYSLVRHPMTLGYIILLAAFGFYNGSLMTVLWIFPLLGFVFYQYLKNREERRLALWFGKDFETYQKATPLLFPKILKKGKRNKNA